MKHDTKPKHNGIHHGENIRKVRTMFDVTQQILADTLGKGWRQKKISTLEDRGEIDEETINKIADALGISPCIIAEGTTQTFRLALQLTMLISTEKHSVAAELTLEQVLTLSPIIDALAKQLALFEHLLEKQKTNQLLLKRLLEETISTDLQSSDQTGCGKISTINSNATIKTRQV